MSSDKTGPSRTRTTSTDASAGPLTIREVAEMAGVSTATVSRVMNGVPNRVSRKTTQKVLAVVEQLNYRPSPTGSTLRSGTSRSLAVLVPQISNSLNMAIAKSVETALRRRGGVMLLCGTDDNPETQDYYLREMCAHSVFGIVMLGVVPSLGLEAIHASGLPLVFVNRRSPLEPARPFVGIDNFRAGKEVGLHFTAKGIVDYMIFHTPLTSSATQDRVNGLIAGMAGMKSRDSVPLRSHTKEEAYAAATKHLQRNPPPQAIFCSTDEIAYGVARRCVEIDLLPQRDVMIFGFDGNPLNPYIAPWLGTVEVPYDDFGEAICSFFDDHQALPGQSPPYEYLFPYTITGGGRAAP